MQFDTNRGIVTPGIRLIKSYAEVYARIWKTFVENREHESQFRAPMRTTIRSHVLGSSSLRVGSLDTGSPELRWCSGVRHLTLVTLRGDVQFLEDPHLRRQSLPFLRRDR